MQDALLVEPCATSGRFERTHVRKCAQKRAGRGRVTDSHLTDTGDVVTRSRPPRERNSVFDCLLRLLTGHRRRLSEVARSACDFTIDDAVLAGGVHTAIHDRRLNAVVPAQHVDGCAATEKIPHHLSRHRGRVGTDAFRRNAMVGAEDVHALAGKFGNAFAPYERVPRYKLLELAQAARRFCEIIPSCRDLTRER